MSDFDYMLLDRESGQRDGIDRRSILRGVLAGGLVRFGSSTGTGTPHCDSYRSRREPSCSAALLQSGSPSTFTIVTHRAPSDLDPHSVYDAGSGVLLQGPFEGLIRLTPGTTDRYDPKLAESWSSNADKSVWTFKLRDGVAFQDGTPFDADAARGSFERLFALGLAPSSVLGRFIEDPSSIHATDRLTLVFDLGRSQPLFEAAMGSTYGTAIVNVAALRAHEVEGDWGHGWAQTTSDGLGTGPYRISEFEVETGAVMERHADYWAGWHGEHFERVVLRVVVEAETRRGLVERGDADLVSTLPLSVVHALENAPGIVVDRRESLAVRYVAMTVAGPLRSPEARQGLCWAFPYDDVLDGVYDGFAKRAEGPVAELCRGFSPPAAGFETDLDRARTLLRRAGVRDGSALSLMVVPGNPEVGETVELFQANLAEVGIALDIQQVDFATIVAVYGGDGPVDDRPNLIPSFWQPDYNDAWNQVWPQVSCGAWQSGNGGRYCNARVEDLLESARTTPDERSYLAALAEIQHIVAYDDPAAIYYAQPLSPTVLRSDVAGFAPDLVVGDLVDFYALSRIERGGAG